MDPTSYKIARGERRAQLDLAMYVEAFGDELAKRHNYKVHEGFDAVVWHIVKTFHWPPSQVRAMNTEDIRFLLAEEMRGWSLPKRLQRVAEDDDAAPQD